MACVIAGPVMEATLQAYSASWAHVIWGPWFELPGGEQVHATVKVKNATTNFKATASVQYAAVLPENPDDADELDATGTSSSTLISADLSTDGLYKAWARVGTAVKGAASSFDEGDVTVTPYRTACGVVMGRGVIQVSPGPASKSIYVPLGGLHSTLGLTKLKLAVYAQDVEGTGTLSYQLVYRTYASDRDVPGTWQTLGTLTALSNNTGDNQGELSVTLTGKSWIEVGIALTPSTADMTATVKGMVLGKLS